MKKQILTLLIGFVMLLTAAFPTVTVHAAATMDRPVLNTIQRTTDGLFLSWGRIRNATSYDIYRCTDAKSYKLIKTTNTLKYTDEDVKTGTKYYYKIVAKNAYYKTYSIKSGYKAKVAVKAPKISIKNSGAGQVTVSLSGAGGVSGYNIYFGDHLYSTTSSTRVCTALLQGAKYKVKVRSYLKKDGTTYYSEWRQYGTFQLNYATKTSLAKIKTAEWNSTKYYSTADDIKWAQDCYDKAYKWVKNAGVKNGMDKTTAYKKIVKYVCDHCGYSLVAWNDGVYDWSNAVNNGNAVCQGYAELIQVMCNIAGIKCWYDGGKSTNPDGRGPHAWNIVELNEVKYYSDVTFYDSTKNSKWLLSRTLWSDHISDGRPEQSIQVPTGRTPRIGPLLVMPSFY